MWDLEAVEKMAGEEYPALAAAWRNLALYSVGSAFSSTCGDVSPFSSCLCFGNLLTTCYTIYQKGFHTEVAPTDTVQWVKWEEEELAKQDVSCLFEVQYEGSESFVHESRILSLLRVSYLNNCPCIVWLLCLLRKACLAAAWLQQLDVSAELPSCLQCYASNGQEEDPAVFEDGARSRDMVEPLNEQEEQPFNFWNWLKWWVC